MDKFHQNFNELYHHRYKKCLANIVNKIDKKLENL